jgi:leucyl aminopeptidase
MSLRFADPDPAAIPLHMLSSDEWDAFRESLTERERAWANLSDFQAKHGQVLVLPDDGGGVAAALIGLGGPKDLARNRFTLGGARSRLPKGLYRLDTAPVAVASEYLGWLFAGYTFGRYKTASAPNAELVRPEDTALAHRLEAIAAGEALTRNLINTPAADMGPPDLADAARELAGEFGAEITVTVGDDLKAANFPMIHAVGRASERAPRLIDIRWGNSGPSLTLVGKGICFDTGGLNLKPGSSMGLMKKDMGGAATVLGLARMILALDLPIRLRVLVPAVENSVSGNAFRPGDVLTSRKGLTVEINNTDAEGRLVLADALALADEDRPDLIVSMATLTGAARVAVGGDLAPFYTDADAYSAALSSAAAAVADPVWRMPFHAPYESLIEPDIADLDNAPSGGFAGSITAALFLRRFVEASPYMHFDIYAWQQSSAAGRPKGGQGQGARALLEALPDILSFR